MYFVMTTSRLVDGVIFGLPKQFGRFACIADYSVCRKRMKVGLEGLRGVPKFAKTVDIQLQLLYHKRVPLQELAISSTKILKATDPSHPGWVAIKNKNLNITSWVLI